MNNHEQTTAFYLETLLLILVFMSVILVLTGVFGKSRAESARARRLTEAVALAGNTAEAFAGTKSAEGLAALLDEGGSASLASAGEAQVVTAYYNDAGRPDPEGAVRVETRIMADSAYESLLTAEISVWADGQEEPVYTLQTAVYGKEAA